MRRSLFIALLASLTLAGADVPRKAPELEFSLSDGRKVNLADYRGKVVCLTFILTT